MPVVNPYFAGVITHDLEPFLKDRIAQELRASAGKPDHAQKKHSERVAKYHQIQKILNVIKAGRWPAEWLQEGTHSPEQSAFPAPELPTGEARDDDRVHGDNASAATQGGQADDTADADGGDLSDLPPEMAETVRRTSPTIKPERIRAIFEKTRKTMTVNDVWIRYYRDYGVQLDRSDLSGRLYRLSRGKNAFLEAVPGLGKGVYRLQCTPDISVVS